MVGVGHADAIWTKKSNIVRSGDLPKLFLQCYALSPEFLEASGNHDGMLDPLFAALIKNAGNDTRGQYQYGKVGHLRQIKNAAIGLEALDMFFFRVDRIDGSIKAHGLQRDKDRGSHGEDVVGCPEQGNTPGGSDSV